LVVAALGGGDGGSGEGGGAGGDSGEGGGDNGGGGIEGGDIYLGPQSEQSVPSVH